MGEEETKPFDWQRMFFGESTDLMFLLEIVFRTSVIFLFALLLLRLLGKRGQGRLSPFEFVIIIALGSAVGDPMFYPDVPILHSMVVIALIVFFTRVLFQLSEWSDGIETFLESRPSCLVADGVVAVDELAKENIARDELLTALRESGFENLGQVRRAYLEPSGAISTLRFGPDDSRLGLPIYPVCDNLHPQEFDSDEVAPASAPYSCRLCGTTQEFQGGARLGKCPHCEADTWSRATEAPVAMNGS